jgi:hypothetical protein
VVNDLDFVGSLFSLVEAWTGLTLKENSRLTEPASGILIEMLSWKDAWPFNGNSRLRRSRYYFKKSDAPSRTDTDEQIAVFLNTIAFTFDIADGPNEAEDLVRQTLKRLAEVI